MGDELEELYRTTYATVVRFLYRKVWDADRAHDLAQEVFIRAMAHRPEKPRAWLFAVAANLARDEARAAVRRKRHLTLLKDDPITMPSLPLPPMRWSRTTNGAPGWTRHSPPSPSATGRSCCSGTPGLSYPEIAQQTGLAVGAVGTTLARARKRLVDAYDRMEQ